MPYKPGQMAAIGPSAIAIHDDGDVARQALGIKARINLPLGCGEFVETATVLLQVLHGAK
jgi:hypothetical protein